MGWHLFGETDGKPKQERLKYSRWSGRTNNHCHLLGSWYMPRQKAESLAPQEQQKVPKVTVALESPRGSDTVHTKSSGPASAEDSEGPRAQQGWRYQATGGPEARLAIKAPAPSKIRGLPPADIVPLGLLRLSSLDFKGPSHRLRSRPDLRSPQKPRSRHQEPSSAPS